MKTHVYLKDLTRIIVTRATALYCCWIPGKTLYPRVSPAGPGAGHSPSSRAAGGEA